MRHIIFILFFFYLNASYSQIIVTDLNNQPIPFVQIISTNNLYLTQTNFRGELPWVEIKKFNNTDTLFFQHISYERSFKLIKDLTFSDTIRLQPRLYELREFSVEAKQPKNKHQIIKACFRTYQANNDSVAYYADGKADYLSKINNDNFNLSIKEFRVFANKKIEEKTTERKIGVSFDISVPSPTLDFLPFQYSLKNNLKFLKTEDGNTEILYQDSIPIGKVEINSKYIAYSFEDINFVGTNKMFKTEVNRLKREVIMVFRYMEGQDIKAIKNFDNLLYVKTLREYKVKHDKDKKFTNFFYLDELFIEELIYVQKVDKKSFNSSRWMKNNSNYTSEFWKTCNCELYNPPIEQIIKGLYEK